MTKEKKGGGDNMATAFADFIRENRKLIEKLADKDVKKTKDGMILLPTTDEWYHEEEWEDYLKDQGEK